MSSGLGQKKNKEKYHELVDSKFSKALLDLWTEENVLANTSNTVYQYFTLRLQSDNFFLQLSNDIIDKKTGTVFFFLSFYLDFIPPWQSADMSQVGITHFSPF